MAKANSVDYNELLSCQICLENFEENGAHIPRLLPCSHTFCEICIKQFLEQGGGNTVKCPNCNKKHQAEHGIRSCPQNKDKLALIQQKTPPQRVRRDKQMCLKHDRDLLFYCKDPRCQVSVCSMCLRADHNGHDWADIEKDGKDILKKRFYILEQKLNANMKVFVKSKQEMKKTTEQCLEDLKAKEETARKLLDHFKKMIQEAEDHLKKKHNKIALLNEQGVLLKSLKQKSDVEVTVSEFISCMDAMSSINDNITLKFRDFTDPVCEPGELVPDVEKMCGKISYRETLVPPDEQKPFMFRAPKPIANTSEIQCSVIQTINTRFDSWPPHPTVLRNNSLVLCGKENNTYKLKVYDLPGLDELCSVTLDAEPRGITGVCLNGRPAVAISTKNGVIEFRDAEDFSSIIHQHSVTPDEPERLCAASPSVLCFQTLDFYPKIVWLDCSTVSPKRTRFIVLAGADDMCCVMDGDKQLLVTVRIDIQVYDTRTDELLFKVEKKLPGMEKSIRARGVASDGRGHLYVCDIQNECIQMFRASDGEYLGSLIKEGEQSLGIPWMIRWCENLSSLIVLHDKGDSYYISVIEVKGK